MGLCKCPKRKVTNLFCFEHRVNVCEYCLIDNHPRCIIQSYLNWLKDSDYIPNCQLCDGSLLEGEVVRLLCYDVFHISCLEKHFRNLPLNTAPAGYRCPACETKIFPAPNQAGKVVDKLKEVLSKYNWARVGLCLPLIDESEMTKFNESEIIEDMEDDTLHGSIIPTHTTDTTSVSFNTTTTNINTSDNHTTYIRQDYRQSNNNDRNSINEAFSPPLHQNKSKIKDNPTILSMEENLPSNTDFKAVPRKILGASSYHPFGGQSLDGSDPDGVDKYKRRSALSWLKRWLRSRMLRSRHDTRLMPRKAAVIFFIIFLALLTFIVFATKVGRGNNDDPSFDPMHNPNIHVARHVGELQDPLIGGDPLQAMQPAAGGR
uniref:Zinc finger protein-like 1 n=1 Tax=Ciona intestinalis TaxID=7719 RepID=F7ASV8_CIOIN